MERAWSRTRLSAGFKAHISIKTNQLGSQVHYSGHKPDEGTGPGLICNTVCLPHISRYATCLVRCDAHGKSAHYWWVPALSLRPLMPYMRTPAAPRAHSPLWVVACDSMNTVPRTYPSSEASQGSPPLPT